ncbi:TonB-dependent receptor [Burkholderia pyrrocinia]|uniref:TonB-dependent receptor n=1 Tax=Burkholderia pyrrocinia TaxID=60550 RepID=UPI002AB2E017|nr:TonB-dependent receptor [Burkholderia pyrrocinia]
MKRDDRAGASGAWGPKTRLAAAMDAVIIERRLPAGRVIAGGLVISFALGCVAAHAADAQVTADSGGAAQNNSKPKAQPPKNSAKSAAKDSAAKTSGNDVTQLEAVTVTADKRVERAIDVPMSVSKQTGKQLLEQHKADLQDYLAGVPGVVDQGQATTNTITVRGLSTGGITNPTVSVLIDDVPVNASTSNARGGNIVPNLDPGNLQGIEVLRGPQGTLYGAASLGGLVKYTTVDPDVSTLKGSAQVDGNDVAHGGFGHAERVNINVPIVTDTAAISVGAFNRWEPGYTRNANTGETGTGAVRTQGGNVTGLFYLGDRVTVRSSLLFQSTSQAGSNSEDRGPSLSPLYGNYSNFRIPGAAFNGEDFMLFTTRVTADLNWATLTSTTGWSNSRYRTGLDMTPTFGFIADEVGLRGYGAAMTQDTQTEKFTQEVRLESPQDGRKLDWRVGAFFTNEVYQNNQLASFANIATGAVLPRPHGVIVSSSLDGTYQEYAAFASTRYHFTDRFDVEVGGRYAHNNQKFNEPGIGGGSSDDGTFTYSIAPRFKLTPDVMVYARVANGYRPGGPNALPAGSDLPGTYAPDKTVNYEIGAKGELLNRRLAFDVAAYHISWKNIQLPTVDPTSGFGYTINSSGAKSDGFEASISARPWKGMTATVGVSYSRAVLTAATPAGAFGLAGDRLPGAPLWSGSLSLRQTYSLGDGVQGFTGGQVTLIGNRFQDFTPSQRVTRLNAAGYGTVDLQTGASAKGWTMVAYVRNLFDRRGVNTLSYLDQIHYNPIFGANLIMPRTIGVSLTKAF